jgi:hypothetical protein
MEHSHYHVHRDSNVVRVPDLSPNMETEQYSSFLYSPDIDRATHHDLLVYAHEKASLFDLDIAARLGGGRITGTPTT